MSEGTDTSAGDIPLPVDATPVSRLALRDGAVVLAALSLWAGADAWHTVTGLAFAQLLAVLDGFLAGAALVGLAHEWGHFAGARWSGGIAPTTQMASFFPLFVFDMNRSDPSAFRAMGVGGNVAHWLAVGVLAVGVPLDTPARAALVSAAFGFAVFASTTEFPVLRLAYAGASPIESFAELSGEKLRRNSWVGAGAALLLFLML